MGLGRPDFVEAVTGPAGQGHHEAIAFLRGAFKQRSRSEWEAWFEGRDICWMPVMSLDEAWDTEHVWARQMRVRDEQGNDHIGVPIKFRNEPGRVHFGLAEVGENTASVLASLGCSEEELELMRAEGAI